MHLYMDAGGDEEYEEYDDGEPFDPGSTGPSPDEVKAALARWQTELDASAERIGEIIFDGVAFCEAYARKGTGTGTCDRPLDAHGQCDRASSHIAAP